MSHDETIERIAAALRAALPETSLPVSFDTWTDLAVHLLVKLNAQGVTAEQRTLETEPSAPPMLDPVEEDSFNDGWRLMTEVITECFAVFQFETLAEQDSEAYRVGVRYAVEYMTDDDARAEALTRFAKLRADTPRIPRSPKPPKDLN